MEKDTIIRRKSPILMFIEFIIFLSLPIGIYLIGGELPKAFGGCISLIILFPIFFYVSLYLNMAEESVYLDIVLFIILCISYLSHIQKSLITSETVQLTIIAFDVLVFVMLCVICVFIFRSFHYLQNIPGIEKVAVLRMNFKWLCLRYLIVYTFLYSIMVSLVFFMVSENYLLKNLPLQMIPTCFLAVSLALLGMLLSMKKWGEQKLDFILSKKETRILDKHNLKQCYIVIMLFVFVLGSIIEILSRKESLLWIESFVVINALLILVWKFIIHRDIHVNVNFGDTPSEELFIARPLRILIMIIINVLLLTSLIVGLLMVLNGS